MVSSVYTLRESRINFSLNPEKARLRIRSSFRQNSLSHSSVCTLSHMRLRNQPRPFFFSFSRREVFLLRLYRICSASKPLSRSTRSNARACNTPPQFSE